MPTGNHERESQLDNRHGEQGQVKELLSSYYDWRAGLHRHQEEGPIVFMDAKKVDEGRLKVYLGRLLHMAYTVKQEEITILRSELQAGKTQLEEARNGDTLKDLTDSFDFGKQVALLNAGLIQLERLIPAGEEDTDGVNHEWRDDFRIMLCAIYNLMMRQ